MEQSTHSVPKRRGSAGVRVETRPIYIEEWLDSLPYIDFNKTSRLILEATTDTNGEIIKPEDRLELVRLYNRPYLYYLESQIKTGAQHTLQSMENMQNQTTVLKQIAINLAQACKLSMEEGQKRKTVWRQKKSPLPAVMMAMNYLSHALIFSYLEYSQPPPNIWRELNELFYFAENMGEERKTIVPPGGDAKKDAASITDVYKKILLASMVDPYHLPFGAIWEIFVQLKSWNTHAEIKPFTRVSQADGCFVVDLDQDTHPIPYSKFDTDLAGGSHRLINTTALWNLVNDQMKLLNAGKPLDDSISLSSFYAKSILKQLSLAWGPPAVRFSPRDRSGGSVYITCGINGIYYYLNGSREFESRDTQGEDGVLADVGGYHEHTPPSVRAAEYLLDQWDLVDQGPGGFAISKADRPQTPIRVGDLIGIIRDPDPEKAPENLALGVIRWLMISGNKVYRVGIQTIAADIHPAAIRARSGSAMDTRFNRAIIAGDFSSSGDHDIILGAGMYAPEREFELQVAGKTMRASARSPVESTVNFEHFILLVG